MIGLDTNVLIRYLDQDDPIQSATASRFVETQLSAQQQGHVSLVCLAELVWVLRTRYQAKRGEVVTTLETLLTDKRLKIQIENAVWLALDEYDLDNVDFADALIVALDREYGCSHTVTFDRKVTKLERMVLLA